MIIHGYSENRTKKTCLTNSVDMVFTSPPYADSEKIPMVVLQKDKYLEWFQTYCD